MHVSMYVLFCHILHVYFMHIYVYICMCVYICMFYVYVYLYVCIYMYVHLCTYMLLFMYFLVHTFVCIKDIYLFVWQISMLLPQLLFGNAICVVSWNSFEILNLNTTTCSKSSTQVIKINIVNNYWLFVFIYMNKFWLIDWLCFLALILHRKD